MAQLDRIRVALTGFPGGPGVATFYALDGPTAVPDLRAMWGSFAASLPPTVGVSVEPSGDRIDDATGELVGTWVTSSATGFGGAATGPYTAPSGAVVRWLTDTILDGKRLKGRTFLVPLGGSSYQEDGTINPANVTSLTTAAQAYVAAQVGNAFIWHRPRKAKAADGSRPAVTARAGGSGAIVQGLLVDKAMVLTSRRD